MTALQIITQDIHTCTLCPLAKSRSVAVPGDGLSNARIMFIGEAPGKQEDTQGKPFVGRAGKILRVALIKARIKHNEVFLTNVVKCRPPNNRLPTKNEIRSCVSTHLNRQIQAINPQIICLLGLTATKALLGASPLSAVRGRLIFKERVYFVTYHPAAAGRNPAWLRTFQADIKELKVFLREKSRASSTG